MSRQRQRGVHSCNLLGAVKPKSPPQRKYSLPNGKPFTMVHHMENYRPSLDAAFHALSNPTRRQVLNRLMTGPAQVKDLAAPFEMGLPAFMKHLRVLEDGGLIASVKSGRVRTCYVQAERLSEAEAWLRQQRALWQASADRLAHFVENQNQKSEDA